MRQMTHTKSREALEAIARSTTTEARKQAAIDRIVNRDHRDGPA